MGYQRTATRVITQSTIVYICLALKGGSANIGIREIAQLEFIQPASQITSFAIYQRTPNAITTESHYGQMKRKMMVVSTRLVLPFFDNRNPTYKDAADEAATKNNEDYSSTSSSKVITLFVIFLVLIVTCRKLARRQRSHLRLSLV